MRSLSPSTAVSLSSILQALFALFLLNSALAMSNLWPTPFVYIDSRIAPEFVYTWCLLLALPFLIQKPEWRSRAVTWFGLAYTALVLGRYFDTTAPALFGRPINLYWDGLQIPRLLWVMSGKYAWWVPPLVMAAIVALILCLFLALRWALKVSATLSAPYTLCVIAGHKESRCFYCYLPLLII
jgi:hypothetical protein